MRSRQDATGNIFVGVGRNLNSFVPEAMWNEIRIKLTSIMFEFDRPKFLTCWIICENILHFFVSSSEGSSLTLQWTSQEKLEANWFTKTRGVWSYFNCLSIHRFEPHAICDFIKTRFESWPLTRSTATLATWNMRAQKFLFFVPLRNLIGQQQSKLFAILACKLWFVPQKTPTWKSYFVPTS